ncbi:MAG: DUF4932 domain-containing protein [Paludibacter sp.]|nr:DUF4932 domain-containing protein [Paludibacter sp.]
MKHLFIILLFAIGINVYSQNKVIVGKPIVDKRIELLSIVFRLAGNQEYSATKFKRYTDDIESYFAPYKNHKLIRFAKELHEKRSIGFDAVMTMAISIEGMPHFKLLVQNANTHLEDRWRNKDVVKFIKLLNSFYLDAHCSEFFKAHEELYRTLPERFDKVYTNLDINWYEKFYGKKLNENFLIINSLANGGSNYGLHIESESGNKTVYAIIGTWTVDSVGLPSYDINNYFPFLLHEFNHSFVNYLTDNNKFQLEESGSIIFKKVEQNMRKHAYANWNTMLSEALVRAAVIKYLKDHNATDEIVQKETANQINRGFIWIRDLVKELEYFDKNRDKYPTLESYMPQLIQFYNKVALNIDIYKTE